MNQDIIIEISKNLNISEKSVSNTLELLELGNTVPFIARYRKELTNNLDEEQIRSISEVYNYQVNLLSRKEDVIRLIDEKKLLTDELKEKILKCTKLVEVEDLYRPFKEKKQTKATYAIENGLEPLAKYILDPSSTNIDDEALKYINDNIKTVEEVIINASYIIAESISDDATYRKYIREYTYNNGVLITKKKKNNKDEAKTYEMYYEYNEVLKRLKPHRYLAIQRALKEDVISVKIDIDEEIIFNYLEKAMIKNKDENIKNIIRNAIKDSYKRLISPSIDREIKSELFLMSEEKAIEVFSLNLNNLLLTPPMKESVVLGFDPAYRTGCKLAVVDSTSNILNISVIYPHEPRLEVEKSKKHILELIDKYKVDIIAIGNGTASRESEAFIAELIKEATRPVKYVIVSEAGASVYSASKLAIQEFPDLHVEERSAISIARRLQDPLSELVKIDPKSIGVGQYQHDVNQKSLSNSLDFVVEKVVNQVGVNINTASVSLLKYVSGLNSRSIDSIIKYRSEHGKIMNREELKKIKSVTDKVYEQSVGFIRIMDGDNILDKTSIHPESYNTTKKLLESVKLSLNDIGTDKLKNELASINLDEYVNILNTDKFTLEDIKNSLVSPNRDLRDDIQKPILKSDILKLDDLNPGTHLQGTVRNVVDFGVFIDVGLKNDCLAHISKLTNKYIKHPSEVLSVGDIVDCYVEEIFKDKNKVSVTLIKK